MRGAAVVALLAAVALVPASPGAAVAAARCATTGPNHNMPGPGLLGGLFGNGRLAASAYRVIRVTPRTRNPDGSIGEKFWWYGASNVGANLRIGGRRLDCPGGRVTGSVSPGLDPANPSLRFWAVGVRFPTVGCWRVIGTADDERLALTVLVRR